MGISIFQNQDHPAAPPFPYPAQSCTPAPAAPCQPEMGGCCCPSAGAELAGLSPDATRCRGPRGSGGSSWGHGVSLAPAGVEEGWATQDGRPAARLLLGVCGMRSLLGKPGEVVGIRKHSGLAL